MMVSGLTNGLTIDGLQKLCIERGDKLIAANNEIFKLRETLENIVICVWADEFKNADAKLDEIDEIADKALKSSEYRVENSPIEK